MRVRFYFIVGVAAIDLILYMVLAIILVSRRWLPVEIEVIRRQRC